MPQEEDKYSKQQLHLMIGKSKIKLKRAKVREEEFSILSRDTGKDVFWEEVRLFVQKRGGLVEEGDEPAQ